MQTKKVTSSAGKIYTYTKSDEIEYSKFIQGEDPKKVSCLKCDDKFIGAKNNRICDKCKGNYNQTIKYTNKKERRNYV